MSNIFEDNKFPLNRDLLTLTECGATYANPEDYLKDIVIDHMLAGGVQDDLEFTADDAFIKALLKSKESVMWIDQVGVDFIVCGLVVRLYFDLTKGNG